MSLWDKLPTDTIKLIFEYDQTYKQEFDKSLHVLKNACPLCTCNGDNTTYSCAFQSSIAPHKHNHWFFPKFKYII